MTPRELLEIELARRGRAWGSENGERLQHMRAQVSFLHRRPKLRALLSGKHFRGKSSIGFGEGCYRRSHARTDE